MKKACESLLDNYVVSKVLVKFMFSKKATKIDEIFLTVFSNCQIDGEDFINFCGLFRKHELHMTIKNQKINFWPPHEY